MKPKPAAADPQQKPMFDAFEMVRLEPPKPTAKVPAPDVRQLTLTTEVDQ